MGLVTRVLLVVSTLLGFRSVFADDAASFPSIARCGEDFFLARVEQNPNNKYDMYYVFQNPAADFICGGSSKVNDNKPGFSRSMAEIVKSNSVEKQVLEIKALFVLPLSKISVGQKVNVACPRFEQYGVYSATVAKIRDNFVGYRYDNPEVEYRCGEGRLFQVDVNSLYRPRSSH